MSDWGPLTYGNPCGQCGFPWSISTAEAVGLVTAIPAHYEQLLRGGNGSERHPGLSWSAGAYVCHVGDNLRIWAERLAVLGPGSDDPIGTYDADLLAVARAYADVPLAGALWSLSRAVEQWRDAVSRASCNQATLLHPERGPLTVDDVVRANAHDAHHHGWDIMRSIRAASARW